MTGLLCSQLAGRDKNVVIIVRTLVSRGVTAAELEVVTEYTLLSFILLFVICSDCIFTSHCSI